MRTREDIKRDVIESLYWDSRVDASEVTVEVGDGTVVLGGSVPTYRARLAAEHDARVIGEVGEVRNDVVVRYPTSDAPVTDDEIRVELLSRLNLDPDIDAANIEVAVDDGWVTLRGSIPTLWQKDLVDDVVLTSRGVLGADNELAIVPTRTGSDLAIADDIVAELERRLVVDPSEVDVTVVNGRVTLDGTVPDWRTRNAVHEAARYTLGVVDVVDNLAISRW